MATASTPMLGQLLVDEGIITSDQLSGALARQNEIGARLGEVLIEMNMVTDEQLVRILGRQTGVPSVKLGMQYIDPTVVPIIPQERAEFYHVIAMFKVFDDLTVAMSDPNSLFVIDDLESITGCRVLPVLCRQSEIDEQIDGHYNKEVDTAEFLRQLNEEAVEGAEDVRVEEKIEDDVSLEDDSPVINLVNMVILNAVRERASDIHIEPDKEKTVVRLRVDGVLHETMEPPARLHAAIVSRIKVMARMDIAERRLPQDGRAQVIVDGREINLRVSTMPTVLGEKAVLRLLDKSNLVLDLQQLGFKPDTYECFEAMLARPHGILLVTGPSGSGKTTTLYSALGRLATVEKNTITVEDPVEYQLALVNQVQVNEAIDLTFAGALRCILRQDPDIVMVGEIRDGETAAVAIQAALTGHLVLSTLHTNDSAGAVTRLLNMEVEPYLLASAVLGALAQRLVRKICAECLTRYFPEQELLDRVGWPKDDRNRSFAMGKGCDVCYGSGLRGRQGIYEILPVDEKVRQLVLARASTDEIRRVRAEAGYRSLKEDGFELVLEDKTTVDEVIRVALTEGED